MYLQKCNAFFHENRIFLSDAGDTPSEGVKRMRYHVLTSDIIRQAGHMARQLGHSYVGTVHLLMALCEAPGGTGQLLRGMGMEPSFTREMAMLLYGVGDAAPRNLLRASPSEDIQCHTDIVDERESGGHHDCCRRAEA